MRILQLAIPATVLALFFTAQAQAGALHIAISANTSVQADAIFLANTPANDTHALASNAAPAPSPARSLSRVEVLSSLRSTLKKTHPDATPLEPSDLSLETDVRVPSGDPALEVTQISFDPFINRFRARLFARSVPALLPFFVTFTLPKIPVDALAAPSHANSSIPLATIPPAAPVVVSSSRLARLHMHSASLDMLLTVRPLQRGHLGEVIRVRIPGTTRVLQARVVGESYLDATL